MDRIDIHLDIRRISPDSFVSAGPGTDSRTLREGVMTAREFAAWRRLRDGVSGDLLAKPNAVISSCRLSDGDRLFLEQMASINDMSGRSIVRTLSVARTIADLAHKERVDRDCVAEALGYRIREGVGG